MVNDRMSRYGDLVVKAGPLSHYVAKNDPRFWHKVLRYEPDNVEAMYHVGLDTEQEAMAYLRQYEQTDNPVHYRLYEEKLAKAIVLMKEALNWGHLYARREYLRMTQKQPLPLQEPEKVPAAPIVPGISAWWAIWAFAFAIVIVLLLTSLPIYVLNYYTDRSVTHLVPYEVIEGVPSGLVDDQDQKVIEVSNTVGKSDLVNQLLTAIQGTLGSSFQGKRVIAIDNAQKERGQAIWNGGSNLIRIYVYPPRAPSVANPKSALLWEPTTVLRSALYQFVKQNGFPPQDLNALTQPFPHNYLTALPQDPERQVSAVSALWDGQGGWVYNADKVDPARLEESIPKALFPNTENAETFPFAPLSIEIDKNANLLTVSSGQQILRQYPVALGRDDKTPEGQFSIAKKVMNPDRSIPIADNPYGFRAMELSDERFAIHGTNDPSSIGNNVSGGCIRLQNNDIEDLYAIIPMNTPVKIQKTMGDGPSKKENPSPWLTASDRYPYNTKSGPLEEDNRTYYQWGS